MSKTAREIELEEKVAAGLRRELIHLNRAFRAEKKLEIAIKALKECVPYVTFKVNIEKNIGCTPPGAYLLTCIKDALGESEDDIERLYK